MPFSLHPQSAAQMRGEAAFRSFHARGVDPLTLDYLRLCHRERQGIFRNLTLNGRTLTPFLELGAETGANSLILVNDLACRGFALDLSRDALRVMPEYARQLGFDRWPWRIQGDAHGLPLRNNSLPFVVTWGVLHHLPDPRPALAEIRRVLRPGGLLLSGDEPVRRRLSLHLRRTRALHSMGRWSRFLLRWHLLPWFVDPDGREAVAAGAAEMQFPRKLYKRFFTDHFEKVDLQYFPYLGGDYRSAGPLGRLLMAPLGPELARKAEVDWFGGALGARCLKAPEPNAVWLDEQGLPRPIHETPSPRRARALLRKKTGQDQLRIIFDHSLLAEIAPPVFSTLIDHQELRPTFEAGGREMVFTLPAGLSARSIINLELISQIAPPKIAHFVFSHADGSDRFWIDCAVPSAPNDELADLLGCPACWTVGASCRSDLCGRPCLTAPDSHGLMVREGRAVIDASIGQLGPATVAACPVNAIDRPPLIKTTEKESYRCPACSRIYEIKDEIIDLLTPMAREALSG